MELADGRKRMCAIRGRAAAVLFGRKRVSELWKNYGSIPVVPAADPTPGKAFAGEISEQKGTLSVSDLKIALSSLVDRQNNIPKEVFPMTFPIVLCHGVCRFDQFWSDTLGLDNNNDPTKDLLHYFKGIRTMLVEKGFTVFHSRVPWAATVDERAEALRAGLERILRDSDAAKVNIIAHSMGGLDARHMLFNDRHSGKIHERIASLTTISTPHWGSPFADWGIRNVGDVIPICGNLGLDIKAFRDLTVAACSQFNQLQAVMDFEKACEDNIRFQTYACRQDFIGVFTPLKLSYYFIEKQEGDNDGLVSVRSAKWQGRFFKDTLENTDHFNALGWWDAGQIWVRESRRKLLERIHGVYAGIARELP